MMTLTGEEIEREGMMVRLSGPMSLDSVAEIREQLLSAPAKHQRVTLDLTEVTEMGLPALQLLIAAQRSFTAQGVELEIVDSPASVWAVSAAAAGIATPEKENS